MPIRLFNFKKKDTEKYPDSDNEEKVGIDEIYVAATTCGLDSGMVKTMTVGNLVDYVTTYNKLHGLDKEENKEGTRMATQEDFDMF